MLIYIFLVIFSVIMHELGHLLTALYFKVKVKAFSLGFGPVLLHKTIKGIDWRISLIPLGGYCDIEERINKPNSLADKSYLHKMLIILAGVFLNFTIAMVCYLINYQSITKGIIIDWKLLVLIVTNHQEQIPFVLRGLKLYPILLQLSLLNSSLGIANLLPIPSLDGGYIWLLPLQKKMNQKVYYAIIYICFGLLMVLQGFLIYWWLK